MTENWVSGNSREDELPRRRRRRRTEPHIEAHIDVGDQDRRPVIPFLRPRCPCGSYRTWSYGNGRSKTLVPRKCQDCGQLLIAREIDRPV